MKVLIAGAGIGGLTLLRALQGLDVAVDAVDLVERAEAFNPAGVGIVLHPNGMRVLHRLGLGEEIEAAGSALGFMDLIRGDSTLRLPLADIWSGAEHPTVAILRTDLHTILARAALTKEVRLHMGRALVGASSPEDDPIAHFQDGSSARHDLIVGADGVSSPLRRCRHPDAAPEPTGLLYWRFAARNVIGLPSDTWRTFERPDASFGFIPVGGGQVHCFIQQRTTAPPCAPGSEEEALRSFGGFCDELAAMIAARTGPLHVGTAMMVRPPRWGRGKCVLIGDAAHAVSPTLSEGGSLAMEDALALALALRGSPSLPRALELYQAARIEPVTWALRMATAQVNSLRRPRSLKQSDSSVAVEHMRRMYGPLSRSTFPPLSIDAGSGADRGSSYVQPQ